MAEFKRLSDVEVIAEPTESANVLIEENGVIKKAPKTAVGGGGDDGNYFISFDGDRWDDSIQSYPVLAATENLYQKITDRIAKYLSVQVVFYNYNDWRNGSIRPYNAYGIGIDGDKQCFYADSGSYRSWIYPDGTIKVNYWD